MHSYHSLDILFLAHYEATQVASAIADVHNVDREGQASMAHTDVSPVQFVRYDGIYRLNDFNRARFIGWNTTTNNEACGYYVGSNPGKVRRTTAM